MPQRFRRANGERHNDELRRAPRARPRDLGIKGDDMPYYWLAGEIPAKRRVCFRGRLPGD
jgi:hypothetical protein